MKKECFLVNSSYFCVVEGWAMKISFIHKTVIEVGDW